MPSCEVCSGHAFGANPEGALAETELPRTSKRTSSRRPFVTASIAGWLLRLLLPLSLCFSVSSSATVAWPPLSAATKSALPALNRDGFACGAALCKTNCMPGQHSVVLGKSKKGAKKLNAQHSLQSTQNRNRDISCIMIIRRHCQF